MTANAVNRSWPILMTLLVSAGIGLFMVFYFQIEEGRNLRKTQSLKLMNGETVKERAERIMPGGRWTGNEWGSSYRVGSNILFWYVKNDRVLAASITTIELFPELSPSIDQATRTLVEKNTPFDPFQFERDHPIRN